MANIFSNNASSLLSVSITGASTSIQIADSSGFPNPTGGDVFYITLEDNAGNVEIVRCSANDLVTTLTVDSGGRGIDGTGAQSFTANVTRVEVRLVKSVVDNWLQKSGGVMSGSLDMNGNNLVDAVLTGAATQITAGEIVNVPLRGLTATSTNEIVVPTDGVSRATAGGSPILTETDDLIPFLDVEGVVNISSATVNLSIPDTAYFRGGSIYAYEAAGTDYVFMAHNGTNGYFSNSDNTPINFNVGLSFVAASAAQRELRKSILVDQSAKEQTVSSSAGVLTIDYEQGAYVNVTLTENITSVVISNPPFNGEGVGVLRIKFVQGAGAYTISWTGYKFTSAPSHSTGTGAIDFVDLWTDDGGTTWFGTMDAGWVTQ